MNITNNEYVHEDYVNGTNRQIEIVYEPLDNLVPLSVTGTIYFGRKQSHPFWWSSADPALRLMDRHSSPGIVSGTIDQRTGVIKIIWDKHPGDHFLCVSYDFDERECALNEEIGKRINWIQEGF
jgi:hypothetical protein